MLERASAYAWFAAGLLLLVVSAGLPLATATDMALSAGTTSLALACFAFGGALLSRRPVAERLGWTPTDLPGSVLLGLVLGLLAASQLAEWAISAAGYGDVGTLADFRARVAGASGQELLLALVGLALLPGLGEELALRGWVQRGLEPRIGGVGAVVCASLLFAALHGDPVHAAGALVLGFYLGAATALAGSVRPAVLCHVVNNLLATLTVAFHVEPYLGGGLVLAGALAGPWAFRRLWLRARTAHSVLGGRPQAKTPEEPPPAAS